MSSGANHSELRRTSSRRGIDVEDRADLGEVGLGVRVDLLASQARARRRLARRVADHRREVADDEHGGVAEILEQPQPPQHHREPEVNVGRRRVDAELHPQRRTPLELRTQLGFGDDVDRIRGQQLDLAVDVHDG